MSKEYKSFFKIVGGNEGTLCHYNTRLDPYGAGCGHDCDYCYAKSLLDFRKLWHPNDVSVANIDKIRRRLDKIPEGSVIRLGGMTDCFQPIEATEGLTLKTIAMMNERNIHQLIVTKSHLIGMPKYMDILSPSLSHIQITVTNTDDNKALQYEKASKSSKRLETWKKLSDAGFDCSLRLSPYVKGFIDFGVINQYKPKNPKILVEFLRINHWIEKWFSQYQPMDDWTYKDGNYRHLPLETKILQMKELMENVSAEYSVCEDVPEHWKYWKENVNHNREDCCNLYL